MPELLNRRPEKFWAEMSFVAALELVPSFEWMCTKHGLIRTVVFIQRIIFFSAQNALASPTASLRAGFDRLGI